MEQFFTLTKSQAEVIHTVADMAMNGPPPPGKSDAEYKSYVDSMQGLKEFFDIMLPLNVDIEVPVHHRLSYTVILTAINQQLGMALFAHHMLNGGE